MCIPARTYIFESVPSCQLFLSFGQENAVHYKCMRRCKDVTRTTRKLLSSPFFKIQTCIGVIVSIYLSADFNAYERRGCAIVNNVQTRLFERRERVLSKEIVCFLYYGRAVFFRIGTMIFERGWDLVWTIDTDTDIGIGAIAWLHVWH